MTDELLENILQTLHQYSDYLDIKTQVKAIIKEYWSYSSKDMYKLHEDLTIYAIKNNIPRRKIYGVLHELVLEFKSDETCSEHLYDSLTNYLDSLDGYCHADSITRLSGDPLNKKEFVDFVKSLNWIKKEYY